MILVLRGISIEVADGAIVALLGAIGAGKTTLFNCISGMHPVSAGKIEFNGTDITALKAHEIARMGLARRRWGKAPDFHCFRPPTRPTREHGCARWCRLGRIR